MVDSDDYGVIGLGGRGVGQPILAAVAFQGGFWPLCISFENFFALDPQKFRCTTTHADCPIGTSSVNRCLLPFVCTTVCLRIASSLLTV